MMPDVTVLKPERCADGDDPVAHLCLVGVAERDEGERLAGASSAGREVRLLVQAETLALCFAPSTVTTSCARAVHDVRVRERDAGRSMITPDPRPRRGSARGRSRRTACRSPHRMLPGTTVRPPGLRAHVDTAGSPLRELRERTRYSPPLPPRAGGLTGIWLVEASQPPVSPSATPARGHL